VPRAAVDPESSICLCGLRQIGHAANSGDRQAFFGEGDLYTMMALLRTDEFRRCGRIVTVETVINLSK
jgi:hypothetical protein